MLHPPRPFTTVILAVSLDGKIADRDRSPARFGSAADKYHLEAQIAKADAVLFGAGTLRSYGTTLPISHPELLQQRHAQNKPPQPIHVVCSASGNINPQIAFFGKPSHAGCSQPRSVPSNGQTKTGLNASSKQKMHQAQ